MAFVWVVLKALIEIAALALVAQLLVGAFAWHRRHENPVYRVLQIVVSPVTRLVRQLTPKIVLDQHIPLATFLILVAAWGGTIYGIARSCAVEPQQSACVRVNHAR